MHTYRHTDIQTYIHSYMCIIYRHREREREKVMPVTVILVSEKFACACVLDLVELESHIDSSHSYRKQVVQLYSCNVEGWRS